MPLIDSPDDLNLLIEHWTTRSKVMVFPGAQRSHDLNNKYTYKWIGGARFDFLRKVQNLYTVSGWVYSPDSVINEVMFYPSYLNTRDKQTRAQYRDERGNCTAVLNHQHFYFPRVTFVECNMTLDITLYCCFHQHTIIDGNKILSSRNVLTYNNSFSISDHDLYCPISNGSSPHWFQQGDKCLRVEKCPNNLDSDIDHSKCCSGHVSNGPISDGCKSLNYSLNGTIYAKYLSLFNRITQVSGNTQEIFIHFKEQLIQSEVCFLLLEV